MNKLVTKKILGFKDKTQTFVINTKPSDMNREIIIQIIDELTLFDFSEVATATLCYGNNLLDLTSSMDITNSSVSFSMDKIVDDNIKDLYCEIVLKDNDENTILITNKFLIRIKKLGGECSC